MSSSVRVPPEWVDDAKGGLDALNDADIDLDQVSVLFRDDDRRDAPPGFSLVFEREAPFKEGDDVE